MEQTQDQEKVTDEQISSKINELSGKQDITDVEKSELTNLKTERQTRYQRRLDEIKSDKKLAEYQLEQEREKTRKLEVELEKSRSRPEEPHIISRETVEAGGKRHFTDLALRSMIDAGQMTEMEAFNHQQERIQALAADKALNILREEQEKVRKEESMKSALKYVFDKYPHWDRGHKNFNPDDPLFKQANYYYLKGMGIKDAMEEAERVIGFNHTRPDVSETMNLHSPTTSSTFSDNEQKPLTEDEKDIAWRMYRDQVNPSTSRTYTQKEAEGKFIKARESRQATRRIT